MTTLATSAGNGGDYIIRVEMTVGEVTEPIVVNRSEVGRRKLAAAFSGAFIGASSGGR